jgi:molecular chaperone DnaK (HSP70)
MLLGRGSGVTAYGIDLGSTYSCIATVDEAGQAVALRNEVGEQTTPSVVYFESAESVVVGREAKDVALVVPDLVVSLIKRLIGEDVHLSFHGQDYTPESISALILRKLASAAQEQTAEVVSDVVITVPAFFGILEREATRRAGQIAGLNVLDILPEPVAAALNYGALTECTQVRHILVYHLGGGTFDTTVIRLENHDIQIVCTDGDHHFGGADWDTLIVNFFLGGFANQFPQLDPRGDEQFMQELVTSAEQVKRELSTSEARNLNVRFGGSAMRLELTREHLEELTSELLERTMEITQRTIATAHEKGIEGLDEVLLVGGMTQMPVIAATLRERFGIEPRLHEPDLAAAKGAALYANMRKVNVADQVGLNAAQIVATAVASSALVPFIQALSAKAADDVYSTLRGLRFRIHPRNKKGSAQAEPVVCIADKLTHVFLELPPALNISDQETLHRLLESLVRHRPDPGAAWLHLSRSDTGDGWNVVLIDSIPPDCTILEDAQISGLTDRHPGTVEEVHSQEQDRVSKLERERRLLREMIKYLADEMDP